MATTVVALPSVALAASSGCASTSLRLNFDVKFNGNVDSSGWTKESLSYCWNDPNPSPQGAGPLSGQSATYSYGGATSVFKSWNNHGLLFNAYDYCYEVRYTFRKLTCDFHVNTEIWIDGANGNAAGKWNLYTSGTCTGWSIVLTSWS
jgi:hypothetical protein